LFILVDDLGWKDLGSYGHELHETPHIDSLAKRGMRFTNAYAACPICGPSRAAIMTGKFPSNSGFVDNYKSETQGKVLKRAKDRQSMKLKEVTLAGVDVGESYGSPKGRAVYSALHDHLVTKRGMAKQACLLARSRGGLMLYCWAAENPDKVRCITGIYPVCNIASYPGLKRACGAYGLTADELEAELAKHNPIDRLTALAKAKVPIFHIHGDKDRVVPLDKNSAIIKECYDKLGGPMTLEVVPGQGHNMWSGWFQSQNLVDFLIAHATRAN